MKKCPFCAEDVQDAAVVCKHCARDIPAASLSARPTSALNQPVKLGGALPGLAIIGGGVIIYMMMLLLADFYPQPTPSEPRQQPANSQPPSEPRQQPAESNSPAADAAPTVIKTDSGQWSKFKYVYIETTDGTIVTFTPFLPRNDAVLMGAFSHASRRFLNIDLATAEPSLEDGWIVFNTPKAKVSFFIVKEDTGEVHSFRIRKE
ncbi:MAG TPA: hypothetical protein VNJ02_11470 [Vicinamibacterales bacterium]|nr:hypothetical protein [Vicinamibacterales bacterium]